MPANPSTVEILLRQPNTAYLKQLHDIAFVWTSNILSIVSAAIKAGNYIEQYDLNQDGYLDEDDFDFLYNRFYGKWDLWQSKGGPTLLNYVHVKKLIAAGTYEADYDLNSDGVVDTSDYNIWNNWILTEAKIPRSDFL